MKTETQTQAGAAEAARYALTRRLIPVLRHHLVVDLQPIGLIYQVLDRKLNAGETELAPIRESLARIDVLARRAVASSLDVVSWLAPDTEASTPLGSGVVDCLNMLRSNFTFRGFAVHNEVGDAPLRVPQAALREVLTAALIAATDGASSPVDLRCGRICRASRRWCRSTPCRAPARACPTTWLTGPCRGATCRRWPRHTWCTWCSTANL